MRRLLLSVIFLGAALVGQDANKKTDAEKPEESKAASWTAFVGGTVWPVSGPVIKDGIVIVKDDKIAAVGRRGEVSVPKSATIVDVAGRHVSPGFVCPAARGSLGVTGHNSRASQRGPSRPRHFGCDRYAVRRKRGYRTGCPNYGRTPPRTRRF